MIKPFCCYLIVFYLLKFQSLFGLENSSFIMISNSPNKKEHADYRIPLDVDNDFIKISNKIKLINSEYLPLFLFYKETGTNHQICSKMLFTDNSKVYEYSEIKKNIFLGIMIDPSDKILDQLKKSVFKGKLIISYWKKKDIPVSVIVDDKGIVYSVSKESSKDISIETIGLSLLKEVHIH